MPVKKIKKSVQIKESKAEKRFYVKKAQKGPQFKLTNDISSKGYRNKKEYKIT